MGWGRVCEQNYFGSPSVCMKLHVVGYGMLHEDSYEAQPEETHRGIPGQMLVFITLYCTLFIRAVRKGSLGLMYYVWFYFFRATGCCSSWPHWELQTDPHTCLCVVLQGPRGPGPSSGFWVWTRALASVYISLSHFPPYLGFPNHSFSICFILLHRVSLSLWNRVRV